MYDYLCIFLPKLFEALAENGRGYPEGMSAEEWKSGLLAMGQHFRNAYDLAGIDLTADMIASIIQQAEEKSELNPVLKTIRPELFEAYKTGGKDAMETLNDIMNSASDSELDEGFRLFRKNFRYLWD